MYRYRRCPSRTRSRAESPARTHRLNGRRGMGRNRPGRWRAAGHADRPIRLPARGRRPLLLGDRGDPSRRDPAADDSVQRGDPVRLPATRLPACRAAVGIGRHRYRAAHPAADARHRGGGGDALDRVALHRIDACGSSGRRDDRRHATGIRPARGWRRRDPGPRRPARAPRDRRCGRIRRRGRVAAS